jgi:hypothetical protein
VAEVVVAVVETLVWVRVDEVVVRTTLLLSLVGVGVTGTGGAGTMVSGVLTGGVTEVSAEVVA